MLSVSDEMDQRLRGLSGPVPAMLGLRGLEEARVGVSTAGRRPPPPGSFTSQKSA